VLLVGPPGCPCWRALRHLAALPHNTTHTTDARPPHPPHPTQKELSLYELEMPGQHMAGHQVAPDATVYLEYISANIQAGPLSHRP
jgi:hypothetical protein